jgi:hypothetical protein
VNPGWGKTPPGIEVRWPMFPLFSAYEVKDMEGGGPSLGSPRKISVQTPSSSGSP